MKYGYVAGRLLCEGASEFIHLFLQLYRVEKKNSSRHPREGYENSLNKINFMRYKQKALS